MADIQKLVEEFDYEDARPHDLATLLEQVYLHYDSRLRGVGPHIIAQNCIQKYEEAVVKRAAPELHAKTTARCRELREVIVSFETSLSKLEKDNTQTRA